MKRAAEVFVIDEAECEAPVVDKVWTARSAPESEFVSVAETHWQIVVTTVRDRTDVVLQGPNTAAGVTAIPREAEFFGIVMRLGTFMPAISLPSLVGRAQALPTARGSFWLEGSWWQIPTPQNADVFVDRLMQAGVLVHDPVASRALQGQVDDRTSVRTLQRRVLAATGVTRTAIDQIGRAHAAVELLGRGIQPAEVALRVGYSDQPHLTRSIKRFIGQTPSRVVGSGGHWSASSAVR